MIIVAVFAQCLYPQKVSKRGEEKNCPEKEWFRMIIVLVLTFKRSNLYEKIECFLCVCVCICVLGNDV